MDYKSSERMWSNPIEILGVPKKVYKFEVELFT